ncbi:MAG: hypothetical protein KDB00_15935, partial [Planctomycetales bacterium]|nr:hypothetical protein [Planctomycetales bacterium]
PVGPVANVNDAPTGSVVISGIATEGEVLTADVSGIADADGLGTFSYLWSTGATTASITLGNGDVGQNISVAVSYTDGHGTLESLTSASVGPVANVNDIPVGQPTISGTAQNGHLLSSNTNGISDADGIGPFAYQWMRAGIVIAGATGNTYQIVTEDVGFQISVQVSYTDGHGTVEGPLVSVPTAVVTEAPTNETKFYVVDGSNRRSFQYGADGNLLHDSQLSTNDEKPRGVASNPEGTILWVVDGDGMVFVYDDDSDQPSSWKMKDVDKPEGIAVHGDDLWVVDRETDRLLFFAGGALLRSGRTEATSSFRLRRDNRNPMGLATDGTHLWVVNDTQAVDKVFRYAIDGTPEGSWTIDALNSKPTGLTIDPSNVSHVWIVDSRSDAVYQYDNAAARIDGEQLADATFQLAESNLNPQGIADPPVVSMDGENSAWTRLDRSSQGSAQSWNNLVNPLDANDDGQVTTLDALTVINQLSRGSETLVSDLDDDAPFVDVSADGRVTALDALMIINGLGRLSSDDAAEHTDTAVTQLLGDDDDERESLFGDDFDDIVADVARSTKS